MNISRNNYEEFFMLYADNELSAADKKAVEAFVEANPDLQQELALFQQFKVSPDETMIFEDKHLLLKPEAGSLNITAANCESFFVLYADDELAANERAAVEDFVSSHPQWQAAFTVLQQAKLQTDENIVFENKAILYRKEEDDKVIPFWWRRMAVAAAVLIAAGLLWFNQARKKNDGQEIVKGKQSTLIASPSIPQIKDSVKTSGIPDLKNEPPVKEILAVTDDKKTNQPAKNIVIINTNTTADKTNNTREVEPVNTPLPVQEPERNDVAVIENPNPEKITIPPAKTDGGKKVEISGDATAAAGTSNIDQQTTILDPDKIEKTKTEFASQTDDKVEVLNTSVNTKSSLRGFLRKASRMIARKTNDGNENSGRKTILIGGFPIVVR